MTDEPPSDGGDRIEVSRSELEAIVDRAVEHRLESLDPEERSRASGSNDGDSRANAGSGGGSDREIAGDERGEGRWPNLSRRAALGLAGGGALFGLGGFASGRLDDVGYPAEIDADAVAADRVEARSALTVGGRRFRPGEANFKLDAPGYRYVESVDEIQPSIDDLSEPNDDGTRGGVVQLGPGVYEPETTIWLKAGVTLSGVRAERYTNRRNRTDLRSTVITTAGLDDEPTFQHNGDHPHPHYPLVATYRTPPLQLEHRDPTEEEIEYWGHNTGLRNVILDAGPKRRWSEDDTYFGVYDATVFSRAENLRVENVETRNFLGYGGFYNGCRNVRDVGSRWTGGATDFHCSALTIHTAYPPDPTVYSTGIWDVEVRGPPPTVETFGHDMQFVAGGNSRATIEATGREFVGDEQAFWDGEAPLVDPADGETVYKHDHGNVRMEGYAIDGHDRDYDGVWCKYNNANLRNVRIGSARKGFRHAGRNPTTLSDCRISNSDVAISCESQAPNVNGLEVMDCDVGIDLSSGHSNVYGTFSDVIFEEVGVGLRGTNNERIVLNHPDFTHAETAIEEQFDELVVHGAVGR